MGRRIPQEPVVATIENMTPEGRGVARIDGKTVFVDGALPGETVSFRYTRCQRRYDEARTEEVLQASSDRVAAECAHFGICGGCSLQHMNAGAQLRMKQQTLRDNLERIGKVSPVEWAEPITAQPWGYRRKARLGVKYVPKKGGVLVGFRERSSPYLAMIERCPVLHPGVGERIMKLRQLMDGLEAKARIPQIEVAVDESDQIALVFRNLDPLSTQDQQQLTAFAQAEGLQVYLQPAGPESVTPLWPQIPQELAYGHPEFDVSLKFSPLDFFQVNSAINRAMVPQAMAWLDVQPEHRVLDLFCGLGNFTLPLARRAQSVLGVEGDAAMVARAADNARLNGLSNVQFKAADLTDAGALTHLTSHGFERVLLDPPRLGALATLPAVAASGAERLVYVSCNPATLARDAEQLVHTHGYVLERAGVMDMFPHTAHVESMALFVKGRAKAR
ncbi:23S rRNA m(5)U-1939 methyltransferase [Ectothiorhodosinus mongolicus]|uniref:23S rRNA (uracil(1939)-C(5))-methyltransferase RlmD n=1 Tax=Ectothiorhodosinus mongolicus TaxID=233100 RepID=A0A1R3VMT0_9GAMM|nr:23S rRNA (uracil(1939)-C(5))-methyltransferase RlmD [Ectothiorhodosinus mongolicus]ULX56372.1 23S rRNA (uracil(1939)-C(5))-methyltransferase RlmD [Ectothiorhodosinus mongolicus]SIT65888.1 23S rRNA m(5)U-1939 methyltransferase [Ectothiorhodosinus mongolicus]